MFLQRCGLLIVGLMLMFFSVTSVQAMEVTVSPMVGGYVFENNLGLKNSLVYSLGLGLDFNRTWSVEGFADYVQTERDGSSANRNFYSARIGALYHFKPIENMTPYLMAGAGVLRFNANDDGQFTYGLGTKLEISDNVAFRFEARHVVGIDIDNDYDVNDTYNMFSFSGGLVFKFGDLPESTSDYESQIFEPEPTAVEEQAATSQADTELAAVVVAEDSDNDGVIDVIDRCPVTPSGTPVDAEGCPETVKFIDSDGDGVSDMLDACPDTPAEADVDMRGCPPPDSDGDGVLDVNDKCEGSDPQFPVDETGCPALTEKLKIAGLVIEYATSQTGFSEEAARELKLLAAKVNSTDQGRLLVEGHTDSVGGENHNLKLSQERAEKVRQTLIKDFGVAAERVVAKGYGPFEPVADNSTQEGRQQNRRVVVRYEP